MFLPLWVTFLLSFFASFFWCLSFFFLMQERKSTRFHTTTLKWDHMTRDRITRMLDANFPTIQRLTLCTHSYNEYFIARFMAYARFTSTLCLGCVDKFDNKCAGYMKTDFIPPISKLVYVHMRWNHSAASSFKLVVNYVLHLIYDSHRYICILHKTPFYHISEFKLIKFIHYGLLCYATKAVGHPALHDEHARIFRIFLVLKIIFLYSTHKHVLFVCVSESNGKAI